MLTVGVASRKATRHVDPNCVLVVHDTADVAHGCVDEEFLLFAELAALLRVGGGQGTRVAQYGDTGHVEVAYSRNMHLHARAQVGAADVAIDGDGAIALALGGAHELARCEVLETVGEQVRVGVAEDEGAELHDADEAGEVEDLGVGVAPVEHAGEVEELGALVDLGPEALLEGLFGVFECRGLLDEVEVGEDADDLGEAMGLEDVEELEGLHLEAEGAVDHEEDEVGDFANVDHAVDVVVALDEGEAALLAADDGDGAFGVVEGLLGEPADETLEQRRLSNTGWADNGDDDGGRVFIGSSVD